MSFRIVADVLDYAQATLGNRLVLIAIAECADDERREAWPSIELLKQKAKLSEAAVHRAVRALVKLGELEVIPRPGRSNVYRVPDLARGVAGDTPVKLTPLSLETPGGVAGDTPGVSLATPRTISEPVKNHQKKNTSRAGVYSPDFEAFWNRWFPAKRVGKAEAWAEWQALKPDAALQARILDALDWQTQQPVEDRRFILHACRWLKRRRWEDERPATTPPPHWLDLIAGEV